MADIHARLDRAREVANDLAGNATARIVEGAEKARETAEGAYSATADRASAAYAGARDRAQSATTRVNRIVHDHPIATVAGAVAAGAVVAWMFPRSRAAMKALPGLVASAGASMAEAALAGDESATEALDARLASLHRELFCQTNPIPAKWALHRMGLIGPTLRLPLTPLESFCHEGLEQAMLEAGCMQSAR